MPALSEEEVRTWLKRIDGYEKVLEYRKFRERAIQEADEDPLRKGFELPFWHDFREFLSRKDELYALGGNGPGKTEIGSKLVVETLVSTRGMRVLCVAQNETSSKQLQQPGVYKYLPPGLRTRNESALSKRRDRVTKVNYSPAGGFTESTFVLPNRSQCWFKTVEQYERDKLSFEGPEYDLCWIDEPAPIALVDTLSYRVGKRRGKFLFTFTAVHGFDAVCNRVLTGARVLVSLPMNWVWDLRYARKVEGPIPAPHQRGAPDPRIVIPELRHDEEHVKGLPPGHMPYMMQPLNPTQGVIFLWTHWNLFLPRYREDPREEKTQNNHWPELFKKVRGKSRQVVRTRLFGWAEKISGCQFPQFSPDIHVIPASKVPEEGTDYMSGDPATARSYFFLWARVDEFGRKFIFDESPRCHEEGEWVTSDGERGDGTRVFAGRGVDFYKQHLRRREREHQREPVRRKGDPRAFATEAAAKEGGQSLFDLFLNDGRVGVEGGDLEPMFWEAAKIRQTIDLDLEKVNAELAWDDSKGKPTRDNEPSLYVSDRCENLIRCMLNWHPDQGRDSPYKDPVDALRYLFDEPLHYLDPKVPEVVGGKGW